MRTTLKVKGKFNLKLSQILGLPLTAAQIVILKSALPVRLLQVILY